MHICGLEKMSLVDFDGLVASTIFTGGCNFKCGFCHNSALVLDTNALTPMSQDEIFSYLTKRFGILDGVCVSGGEPTLQKDLPEFIEKIKEGITLSEKEEKLLMGYYKKCHTQMPRFTWIVGQTQKEILAKWKEEGIIS